MKTVTIPTCANPFVVIVNGIKYTYPAGATMEVPDDVAEVIEQHEEARPEPAPVLPPFASVPSSGGGGGLPVVVLTTECVVNEETPLSAEECAALDAAAATNMPAVIRFTFNGMSLNFLFNLMGHESVTMYSTTFPEGLVTFMFAIARYEGTWIITAAAIPGGA